MKTRMLASIEQVVSILTLLYLTRALVPMFFPPPGLISTVAGISIQLLLYGSVFLFCIIRWRSFLRGLKPLVTIALLMFLALASTTWSQYASMSLRRGSILCASTLFGAYFALRFSVVQQFRMLALTFSVVQVLSIVFALCLPSYGLDHTYHVGAWRGVFIQKNELGREMVFAALVFLFSGDCIERSLRWMGVFASLGLLLMSHSVTAALVLVCTVSCTPLIWILRTKFTFALPVLMTSCFFLCAIAAFAYSGKGDLLLALHRSENMSGRTLIWRAVLPEIIRRPILGYGYSAFWLGTIGASGDVAATIDFSPAHAHNGFLDIWLELGGVGFVLFLIAYLSQWRITLANLRHTNSMYSKWSLLFLILLLLYNLTEGTLLEENRLAWVLFTANAVNLAAERYAAFIPISVRRKELYAA